VRVSARPNGAFEYGGQLMKRIKEIEKAVASLPVEEYRQELKMVVS
jgi:hypothetical protein